MLAVALSPEARALIQADRAAHRPTAADRRRVSAALRAQLGPSVLPTETPLRDLLFKVGWHVPSGAALGICLVGGALFLALRPTPLLSPARKPNQPASTKADSPAQVSAPIAARAT